MSKKIELKNILNLQFDILVTLNEQYINQPTPLDFQIYYEELLGLHEMVQTKRIVDKFRRIHEKLNLYIAKNATFLAFSPA